LVATLMLALEVLFLKLKPLILTGIAGGLIGVIGQNVLVISPNKLGNQMMYEARSRQQHHPNEE
jgi:hypothetical protein